jgi:hypothetical protein
MGKRRINRDKQGEALVADTIPNSATSLKSHNPSMKELVEEEKRRNFRDFLGNLIYKRSKSK